MKFNVKFANELYEEMIKDITKTPEEWISFLKTSTWMFEYTFGEQLLIYAQRPDARACASMGFWNKSFHRWIKKGTKAIRILKYENGESHLENIFDISDTYQVYGKVRSLWNLDIENDEEDYIDALESRYGDLKDNSNIQAAIISAVDNLVEDNINSYLEEIPYYDENSQDNFIELFKGLVKDSVVFAVNNRCGIKNDEDTYKVYFENINVIADPEVVAIFGTACRELTRDILRETRNFVKNKSYTFDNKNKKMYLDNKNNEEGRGFNVSRIQRSERVSNTTNRNAEQTSENTGDIRESEGEISSNSQDRNIRTFENDRATNTSLEQNGRRMQETRGDNDTATDGTREYNGTVKGTESITLDAEDEHNQNDGAITNNERRNIHLEDKPYQINDIVYLESERSYKITRIDLENSEIQLQDLEINYPIFRILNIEVFENLYNQNDLNFKQDNNIVKEQNENSNLNRWYISPEEQNNHLDFLQDRYVSGILQETENLKASRSEIREYFRQHDNLVERVEYIKGIFNDAYTEFDVNGERVGYKTYENVLLFYKNPYLSRTNEVYYSWEIVAEWIEGMIMVNEFYDRDNPLANNDQLQLFNDNQSNNSIFTQELIDTELRNGSGFAQGKFRIYRQLNDSLSTTENIKFLKHEYGIGGKSSVYIGTRIGTDHDSKGILLYRGYEDNRPQLRLTWNQVEKRIKELIRADKYLNEKQKEEYQKWLNEENSLDVDDIITDEEQVDRINNEVQNENSKQTVSDFEDRNQEIQSIFELANYKEEIKEEIKEETKEEVKEAKPLLRTTLSNMLKGIPPTYIDDEEKAEENQELTEEQDIESTNLQSQSPNQELHQFAIIDENLGTGGLKSKYQNNVEAIKLLKKIESENRLATQEEQKILSQYVGWGGLSQAFNEDAQDWHNEYIELKNLLTENEYYDARESTLTAFYTPPIVISTMYEALSNMGFSRGNILEPACGIGNFIGRLPENMQESNMYGVEIDSISGRIAKQLYQKSNILVQGFQTIDYPDNSFDIAIGNVPFENFSIADKKYDKYNFLIHDYFFAKSLDKVRPGGIVAFITSKGTLDKENSSFRKYLSERADLIGAIRLPNNTFSKNAATKVTSDIIFLQKRETVNYEEPEWVGLGETEDGIVMNQYFIEHPNMILGKMEKVPSQYGRLEPTCMPFENSDLKELLNNAVNNLNGQIKEIEVDEITNNELEKSIPADLNVRNFSYTVVNNQIYYRENTLMYLQELPEGNAKRIRRLIDIRDTTRKLIELQTNDASDEEIKDTQTLLNMQYDNFQVEYGRICSRANKKAFEDDSSYYLLCSLEINDDKGVFQRKADMFTKRTIKPHKAVDKVETSTDALILSISEKAKVDLDYMSKISGISKETLISELRGVIFKVPNTEEYVTEDEYLSGNIRTKLQRAKDAYEQDKSLDVNIECLEKVMPEDLTTGEITAKLGSTWIPPKYIEQFMYELLSTPYYTRDRIKVTYSDHSANWNISNKSWDNGNVKVNNTYGTKRINAYKILENTLNLKDVKVFDTTYDVDGKEKRVLNKKETAIACAKRDLIRQEFENWIWKDVDRRADLVRIYNDKFNSIRPREYNGDHIKFDGINPEITLRKHQVDAIAHILYGGNTLLAHEVGAGKTFEMVASCMESKRLGLSNKALFVVPNHIIEQFASEFLQLYPSANILVATKKDFSTNYRKRFCSKIATGEYDAIIIGHSQYEKIPMSPERQRELLQEQIDEIIEGIEEAKDANAERFTIKEMERTKKRLVEKQKKLNDQSRKDDVIYFEELGVDKMFVDEAHYFKNRARRCHIR